MKSYYKLKEEICTKKRESLFKNKQEKNISNY